jgi:asparagine synthase (glutamine-hydrolysing)
MEGHIWGIDKPDILYLANILGANPRKGIKKILQENIGNFAIISLDNSNIFCGRDPVGATPIYLGENSDIIAIASNKKTLWKIGLTPKSIPPGTLTWIQGKYILVKKISEFKKSKETRNTERKMIQTLDQLMQRSAENMSNDINNLTVTFSGGIDSTLIAHYLKQAGNNVNLHCVGVEGSADFKYAKISAQALDLPLIIESFTEDQVKKAIDPVLYSIEEASPMNAGIAIPLYWVAKHAFEQGIQVIFSGNGSDELFGGYKKYLTEYHVSGSKVKQTMFNDVTNLWSNNLERDTKTCNDLSIQLRLLFTYKNVINYGLKIPLNLKLPENNSIRKLILRKLAKKIGFPEIIINRPKKAVQYSTGVSKMLKKTAKKSKVPLHVYLKERFKLIKKKHSLNPSIDHVET